MFVYAIDEKHKKQWILDLEEKNYEITKIQKLKNGTFKIFFKKLKNKIFIKHQEILGKLK